MQNSLIVAKENKMKIIIPLVIFFTILTYSCESGNEPGKETKSPRDYTWSADTLQYENSSQTMMYDIWASGKNNIFVCGHNSAFMATLWRYNGTNWNRIDLFADIEMGPHILNEIFGFPGPYNYGVWIAGERVYRNDDGYLLGRKTMILHNDGVKWEEEDIHLEGRILTVHGARPDNVWFGGDHGRVYHWNGNSWENEIITIPIPEYSSFPVTIEKIRVFNSEVYIQARIDADISRLFFMKKNNDGWEIIDRMQIGIGNSIIHWGWADMYVSDWGDLYTNERGIWKWETSRWTEIISTDDQFIDDMMGTNENNMFLVGSVGIAYHWNGSDLYRLPGLFDDQTIYTGVWCFEDEVIIMGFINTDYGDKTIIYTGK
jgi:hypothetical protein